jgi:hypothetical protein
METKVPTVHPAFEPNQILTSTHLNQLREYLDDENRLTRVRLSGFGIVCGLEISFEASTKKLTVKKGYGISTEGYLLELAKDTTFTEFRTYKDPFTPKYEFGITGNPNLSTVEELLPAAATDSKPVSNLTNINNKVAVLFYEFNDVELKSCTGSNCDNKGKKREMQPRVLLLSKDAVQTNNNEELLSITGELELLNIPRLSNALQKSGKTFKDITSYSILSTQYKNIITEQQSELEKAITNAYDKYAAILGLSSKDKTAALNALKNVHLGTKAVQYVYDHLKDVTEAYNEFIYAAHEFRKNCFPALKEFPRHLLLGKLNITDTTYYDEYRSYFLDAPLLPQQDREMVKAQMLFHKMLVLLQKFQVILGETIKITPSKHYPLAGGDRSLPYYYNPDTGSTLKFWNPERTLRKREKETLSYHAGTYATTNKYVYDPLSYSIDEFPLLRIEGFIGQKQADVEKKLIDDRKKYNLAFDILSLKIENSTTGLTVDYGCGFSDLQLQYLSARSELITFMKGMIEKINITSTHYSSLYPTLLTPIFTALIDSIKRLNNTLLPYEVKDFSYASFIAKYKDISKEAILLKVNITNLINDRLENDFYLESNTTCIGDVYALSRLSSMIDPLLDNAGWVQLAVIESTRKWREAHQLDQKKFSEYADKHPGMEHIAGVKPGGTFVIVYSETDEIGSGITPQVVADFALPYSCCTDSCQGVSDKVTLPLVAMPEYFEMNAVTGTLDKPFDVLSNDFTLEDFSVVVAADVTFTLIHNPLPSHVRFIEETTGTGRGAVKKIRYTNSDTSKPGVHVCSYELRKGGVLLDSSTVVVNIRKQVVAKPLARFDVATTMENKKVNIYALKNDMPVIAQLVPVARDGATLSGTVLRTALNNIVTVKGTTEQYFEFDPSGSGNITETTVDFFTYKLSTGSTESEEVKVTVYILPCCGIRIIFKLPKDQFCKNGKIAQFTIEGTEEIEGLKYSDLEVKGPGVIHEGKDWFFDPTSSEVTTTNVTFRLLYKGMVLALFEAVVVPIASYTYTTASDTKNVTITFKNTSVGAKEYAWQVGKKESKLESPSVTFPLSDVTRNVISVKLTATGSKECFDTRTGVIDLTVKEATSTNTKTGEVVLTSTTGNALDMAKDTTVTSVSGYTKTLTDVKSFNANLSGSLSITPITLTQATKSLDLTDNLYTTITKTTTAPKAAQQDMTALMLEQSLVTFSMLEQGTTDIDPTSQLAKDTIAMATKILDLNNKKLIPSATLTEYKAIVTAIAANTNKPNLRKMLTEFLSKLG